MYFRFSLNCCTHICDNSRVVILPHRAAGLIKTRNKSQLNQLRGYEILLSLSAVQQQCIGIATKDEEDRGEGMGFADKV